MLLLIWIFHMQTGELSRLIQLKERLQWLDRTCPTIQRYCPKLKPSPQLSRLWTLCTSQQRANAWFLHLQVQSFCIDWLHYFWSALAFIQSHFETTIFFGQIKQVFLLVTQQQVLGSMWVVSLAVWCWPLLSCWSSRWATGWPAHNGKCATDSCEYHQSTQLIACLKKKKKLWIQICPDMRCDEFLNHVPPNSQKNALVPIHFFSSTGSGNIFFQLIFPIGIVKKFLLQSY